MYGSMIGWRPLWDWIWQWMSPVHVVGTVLLLVLLALHMLAVDLAVRDPDTPKARQRLETKAP